MNAAKIKNMPVSMHLLRKHPMILQTILRIRTLRYRFILVLHELQEPYKEVFQLRVFGELSFSQIGIIFGKTENWARVTYHRARLKIKERMDHHES